MRKLLSLTLPLVFTVAAAIASAQLPALGGEGKKHLDRGVSLYAAGSYDEAVAEFQAGLKVTEHPDLFYALAQAHRKRGDCASAIPAYRRFLAASPPAEEAKRAEANVKRCEEALASQPAPAREPERPAAAPESTPPATTPSATASTAAPASEPSAAPPPGPAKPADAATSSASGGGLRLVGLGVMASGGLLLGVGGYFAARAASDWDDVNQAAAKHAPWSGDLQRRYDSAGSAETNATILFVAGGSAAALGGVLYYLGWSAPRVKAAATIDPAMRGGRMVVRCEF